MAARPRIRAPSRRICERCGRREAWDADQVSWVIDPHADDSAVGEPHCIHEWDINGTFSPYA